MNDNSLPKPTPKKLIQPADDKLLADHSGGDANVSNTQPSNDGGSGSSSQSTPTGSSQPTPLSTEGADHPATSSAPTSPSPSASEQSLADIKLPSNQEPKPPVPADAPTAPKPPVPIMSSTSPTPTPKPTGPTNTPPMPVPPKPSPANAQPTTAAPNPTTPPIAVAPSMPAASATPKPLSPSTPPPAVKPTTPPSPVASVTPLVGGPAVGTKPATPSTPAPGVMPSRPLGAPPVGGPTTAKPMSGPAPVASVGGMKPVQPSSAPVQPAAPGKPATPPSNPPTPPTTSNATQASSAKGSGQPKKSLLRFLPYILLAMAVIGAIAGGLYYFLNVRNGGDSTVTPPTQTQTTQVTYWGLWEPTTVLNQIIADFEAQNPGVKVNYVQQSHQEYRERLQTAIAAGQGPDVFRFHASWTPMLRNELSFVPERIMTTAEFSQVFYPVATQQLTINQKPVGMPTMYDGLGLYYNKDIFSVANKPVPQDWEELKTTAQDLTIRSGETITRGGVALGTTSNVEHFSDIIGLMLLQNGADPADPTTQEGQDAMVFYNSFADTLEVWDDTLPQATVAFARGDVAMMIAPSWRVHEIKALNPNLNFDVAPVPQLPGGERIAWASYWAEGVSAQSRQKDLAWKFVDYLASAEVQQKIYSDARQVRAFGPIYSRTDMAEQLATEPYVAAYLADAPYARSWYLNAYTHDNGLNDRIIKYYQDAINASKQGDLETALETAKQGVAQVLQQYGLAAPVAPAQAAQ